MTTPQNQTTVTHIPERRYVAPAARAPQVAAPAPVHTTPVRTTAPVPPVAAPVATPVRAVAPAPVQHRVVAPQPAPQPRTVYQSQPAAQYRPPVAQQRPIFVQPVTNNYYSTQQQRRDGHHPHYQSQPSSGNFLTGLLAGGFIGTMLGRGMFNNGPRSTPYSSAQYPSGYPQGQQAGTGQPMHPAKFESMMEAAAEGRPFTRIRGNNGEEVPTTPEDRQMFKQVMFNMLRRAGQPVDENAMFIPGIMHGPNRMHPSERGTHISHFSDDFRNPSLGNMVDRNYDMLRDQYVAEYRQFQREQMGPSTRQPVQGYQQQSYYQPSYQRPAVTNIRLF